MLRHASSQGRSREEILSHHSSQSRHRQMWRRFASRWILIQEEWKPEARKAVTTDVGNIQLHTHILSRQIRISYLPHVCLWPMTSNTWEGSYRNILMRTNPPDHFVAFLTCILWSRSGMAKAAMDTICSRRVLDHQKGLILKRAPKKPNALIMKTREIRRCSDSRHGPNSIFSWYWQIFSSSRHQSYSLPVYRTALQSSWMKLWSKYHPTVWPHAGYISWCHWLILQLRSLTTWRLAW